MPAFWQAGYCAVEHLKPLSPHLNPDEAVRPSEEWQSPDKAGMVLETEGIVGVVGDEEEIVAETRESVVAPKGLPSPSLPSKAEVEHYNLTHLPYRSWCPFCVGQT